MKKIIIAFMALLFPLAVFADDRSEVLQKFDKYVNDANAYSNNLPAYYTKNAKIIRVVNKKQGGQQSVIVPFDRYLKELKNNAKFARVTGYKNKYTNRKITKTQTGYKVSATRTPRNDKTGLPCHFVFVKQGADWLINEESMTTNVQTFLTAK